MARVLDQTYAGVNELAEATRYPTNVFDRGVDGVAVISRHDDCQTCFQREANCPVDALFVAPHTIVPA